MKAVFSPEDAEIYVHRRIHPEPVEVIAKRSGENVKSTSEKLEKMFRKETVLKHVEKDAVTYAASVIGPGILEAIVISASDDVLSKIGKYVSQGVGAAVKTGLFRTLPIEVEIPAESKTETYEKRK